MSLCRTKKGIKRMDHKKINPKKTETASISNLFEAILLLKDSAEMEKFFKDLCTPQELSSLAERWRVCQLLHEEKFSYREIKSLTNASLTTISRVARFLTTEPHQGYKIALKRIPAEKKLKI